MGRGRMAKLSKPEEGTRTRAKDSAGQLDLPLLTGFPPRGSLLPSRVRSRWLVRSLWDVVRQTVLARTIRRPCQRCASLTADFAARVYRGGRGLVSRAFRSCRRGSPEHQLPGERRGQRTPPELPTSARAEKALLLPLLPSLSLPCLSPLASLLLTPFQRKEKKEPCTSARALLTAPNGVLQVPHWALFGRPLRIAHSSSRACRISIDLDPLTGLPRGLDSAPFVLEDHPVGESGRKLKVAMSASLSPPLFLRVSRTSH